MKDFAIEYPWRDGMYMMIVTADSAEDAMDRVRQAANHGRCNTPFGCERMLARSRWMANVEVWLRNKFGK